MMPPVCLLMPLGVGRGANAHANLRRDRAFSSKRTFGVDLVSP
jgi:hypothetical protein